MRPAVSRAILPFSLVIIASMANQAVFPGQKYARLAVEEELPGRVHGKRVFQCRCDCGGFVKVPAGDLRSGHTKSCGCLKRETSAINGHNNRKHGHYRQGRGSRTYESWGAMKQRCLNPNHHAYASYGGRGITVCDRWCDSFENFLADMGERPVGKTLERLDNEAGYTPENCCWATQAEQSQNRRKPLDKGTCGKGHDLSRVGIYVGPNGDRRCRECQRESRGRHKR